MLVKIKATKTQITNALFLLVILVTGTFALSLSSQSSFIIEVQGQVDYGYDNKNGYNSEEYYPPEYIRNDKHNDYYPPNDPPADIVVPIDFPKIQEAIDAANEGDVIKVLPGTYTEQLTIGKSLTIIGSGAKFTIIEAPDVLNNGVLGLPFIVEVSNGAQVNMKEFTISGPETSSCGITPFDGLMGISVQEDATLNLDLSIIQDCTFVAVRVGAPFFFPNGEEVGHATITNTDITNYRFTGVAAFTSGSILKITKSNIIGANIISNIPAKVGIVVEFGAKGLIEGNRVSGNICNGTDCGPDIINQLQSFGMVIASAPGSVISNNYVLNNDVGIGIFGENGCCLIDHNKLKNNSFFAILVGDSEHTISNTKIFGGGIGVLAAATTANTVATLDHVKIIDAEIAVKALSSVDLTAKVNVISPSIFLP